MGESETVSPAGLMRYVGQACGFGIAYLAVSILNTALAREFAASSFLWLPTGVALAGYLLARRETWPLLALFQLGADVTIQGMSGQPAPTALAFSLAYLAETVSGAFLALRFAKGKAAFGKLSTTLAFLCAAALAGPALGAAVGMGLMAAFGPGAGPPTLWLSFFASHALGATIVSCPALAWAGPKNPLPRKPDVPAIIELTLIVAFLLAATWIGFASPMSGNPAFRYLLLPFILWAGLRFPLRAITLTYLAVILSSVIATRLGALGGVAGISTEVPVIGQVFFIVAYVFGLLPCVVITGLREADRSLRESEAEAVRLRSQFQDLLETSQDLIWQCDAAGRFTYLNPAWERTLGYGHGDMIGRKYYEFADPGSMDDFKKEIQALKPGGSIMGRELRLKKKDGGSILVICNIKAYDGGRGSFGGARGTAYDVTERRRLEEAEYSAQKRESLGVLAGGLAHDFNNLLAGVFGFIDLALGAKDPEKSRAYLRRCLEPFERAKDLTRQLLTFSKGGAPSKKPGSIAAVLRESVGFALAGRNVQADYSALGEIPDFSFDRNQMGQVFQNIAINACEAMPTGGKLRVAASVAELSENDSPPLPAGRYACLEMSDDGPGIPADILPRVFDPFFTTKPKGSGLGLAISYSIVAKHHGSMRAESEPGKGTRFLVHLPIPRGEEGAAGSGDPVRSGSPARPIESGRALVMDDEGFMRELGKELLSSFGFEVVLAEDGDIALSIIARAMEEGRPIRLALLDLTVPGGMGGLELVSELRRDYGSSIRAIAVSGYAEDPVMADPVAFGFDGSMPKPYLAADLARVAAELGQPRAQPESRTD